MPSVILLTIVSVSGKKEERERRKCHREKEKKNVLHISRQAGGQAGGEWVRNFG